MNHYSKGENSGISSDVCRKCNYIGRIICNSCDCGEIHIWCQACWKADEINQEFESWFE